MGDVIVAVGGVPTRIVIGVDGVLGGFVIKIFHQRRAVVLFDEVDQRLWQMVLLGQVDAVFDVADDDQRAHGRGQIVVPALFAVGHVLHEVMRLEHLADVVEIRPDPDQ